ncbi:MAG: FixH family protein [Xanthomonadaceae bacterium]|nr:FixH family protein [Xanthomonadaceae bacterium]
MRYPREDTAPWYKQFWPWFVITPPLAGIMLGVLLVTAATYDPDGMVVSDYSKEGRGINQSIARAQFAFSLGLAADLQIEGEKVWLDLRSSVPMPQQTMKLVFMHPTRDQYDQELPLSYDVGRQLYYADLEELGLARWHVHLEPEDGSWRLRGRMEGFNDREITMEPSA